MSEYEKHMDIVEAMLHAEPSRTLRLAYILEGEPVRCGDVLEIAVPEGIFRGSFRWSGDPKERPCIEAEGASVPIGKQDCVRRSRLHKAPHGLRLRAPRASA